MARFRPFIMTRKLKPLFVASGPVGSSRKHADLETAQRVEQSSSQISPCKSLAYMFFSNHNFAQGYGYKKTHQIWWHINTIRAKKLGFLKPLLNPSHPLMSTGVCSDLCKTNCCFFLLLPNMAFPTPSKRYLWNMKLWLSQLAGGLTSSKHHCIYCIILKYSMLRTKIHFASSKLLRQLSKVELHDSATVRPKVCWFQRFWSIMPHP